MPADTDDPANAVTAPVAAVRAPAATFPTVPSADPSFEPNDDVFFSASSTPFS